MYTDASGATIENDVWGPAAGWSQTINVNDHSNWQVVGNLHAAQYIASYPHASIPVNQPVGNVATAVQPLMADFDATTPGGVSFDQSFDIWLDGTNYELMIWNSWSGVGPIAQSYNANGAVPTWSGVVIDGVTYDVFTGVGGSGPHCISFLRRNQTAAGTVNISAVLQWITSQGYWANPTLDSVQLGWEIVNTYGAQAVFTMNTFNLHNGTVPPPPPPPPPTYPLELSAGGPASGSYIADAYFSGGTTSSTTSAIDTSLLPAPVPPQSVLQHERYGPMNYTFPGVTPGQQCEVDLLFSENYWTAPGQRQFNVSINGTQELSNFDIYATAGGQYKAVMKSFFVNADANGNITISFANGAADQPKIDGIEVLPGASLTTPIPLNLSAGGPSSGSFIADSYFTGGTTSTTASAIDTSLLTSAVPPQSVLQNERYGQTTYTFPGIKAGTYSVTLLFSENYWTGAGQRQFNVAINGTQVLSNFDILATAGAQYKAVEKSFPVTLSADGDITVQFTNGAADKPKVDGIEIVSGSQVINHTPVPLNISAGGTQSGGFVADAYYSGGTIASTSAAIDTSLLTGTIPPQQVLQDERYGPMTYTIPNLASGNYTVTLLFNEAYWTAAGQRQFNVAINGTQVLSNFDIIAASGAQNKAVQKTFPATVGADGNLVIQFTNGSANFPKVDGIEIVSGSQVINHTPVPLNISAGGTLSGGFVADAYYSGGTIASTAAAIDTSLLTGTIPPQQVLQDERYGPMTYTIPNLASGNYTVTLLFNEAYWTAAGQRQFNVAINGTQVLSNFDIFAAAGAQNKAVQETFPATVGADGNLVIQFTNGSANFPKVDGIEISN